MGSRTAMDHHPTTLPKNIFVNVVDNPEVGTVGIYNKYTRLTFVCYLREKIANCPDDIDERFLTKSGHSKIKQEEKQEVI